jgi:hypothetical protein
MASKVLIVESDNQMLDTVAEYLAEVPKYRTLAR